MSEYTCPKCGLSNDGKRIDDKHYCFYGQPESDGGAVYMVFYCEQCGYTVRHWYNSGLDHDDYQYQAKLGERGGVAPTS